MKKILTCFLFTAFLLAQDSTAAISINIPSGIKIELSGEAEIEFIDVEGKGGAQYKDGFLKKIETRSPYTQIDKTVLNFKLLYSNSLTYNFSLRFDDDGAYADKHYLKYVNSNTVVELGKNRPKVALKRDTESYPLIGTAYWKGRQYHLDIEQTISNAKVGASLALKRPLGYDDAAEDKSFRMLVYDDTEKLDGQTLEYGIRGSYNLKPLKLEGWYYTGKLIDDEDWKKRLHYDFDYYAEKEADTVLSKDANVDHYWMGIRGEFKLLNKILLRGEYINSLDGYLPRNGFYGELSSGFNLPLLPNECFVLLRYGQLKTDSDRSAFPNSWAENNNLAVLKDPQTWDRTMTTIALAYHLTEYAKIKLEYYLLDEITGDTKIAANNENREYQPSVEDNQLLIQLELKF